MYELHKTIFKGFFNELSRIYLIFDLNEKYSVYNISRCQFII